MVRCGIRPAQIRAVELAISSQNQDDKLKLPRVADKADTDSDYPLENLVADAIPVDEGAAPVHPRGGGSRHGASAAPQLRRALSDPSDNYADVSTAGLSRGLPPPASLAATAPIRSTTSRPNTQDSAGGDTEAFGAGSASNRKFSPDYFYAILTDGPPLPTNTAPIYTERDVGIAFASISEGLTKPADHWEDRMAGLQQLQALSCSGALDYDSFSVLLKGIHEQVCIYIYLLGVYLVAYFLLLGLFACCMSPRSRL